MALTNTQFYHSIIRNTIIAFGSLFNELYISRADGAGTEVQNVKVPLNYAGKQKTLAIVRAKPDIEERNFKFGLPSIGFQIEGFDQDLNRKLNSTDKIRAIDKNGKASYVNNPAPYDMQIGLYIASKNIDDVLQIIEQIFPFFAPNYSLKVNYVKDLGISKDLHISLNSISWDDNYEGEISEDRIIIATLTFNLKLDFFGPVKTSSVIKDATATLSDNLSTVSVNIDVSVDPLTANANDSNWNFVTQFTGSLL